MRSSADRQRSEQSARDSDVATGQHRIQLLQWGEGLPQETPTPDVFPADRSAGVNEIQDAQSETEIFRRSDPGMSFLLRGSEPLLCVDLRVKSTECAIPV
jgi:hypothetical protein